MGAVVLNGSTRTLAVKELTANRSLFRKKSLFRERSMKTMKGRFGAFLYEVSF